MAGAKHSRLTVILELDTNFVTPCELRLQARTAWRMAVIKAAMVGRIEIVIAEELICAWPVAVETRA
jgi:hypothetical protein